MADDGADRQRPWPALPGSGERVRLSSMSTDRLTTAALLAEHDSRTLGNRHAMVLDGGAIRMAKVAAAPLDTADPYALEGGLAVAVRAATRYAAAPQTTKDVEMLLRRSDPGTARQRSLLEESSE